MYLIVGLGNPGEQYKDTRHNVGFMVVDAFAKLLGAVNFKEEKRFNALFTKEGDTVLMKPLTYMNLSGEAVQKIAHFFKIKNENIWVVYDDVDLPFGTMRIRPSGSAGTHNGMKSIVQSLGTTTFPRLRIGTESRGVSAPAEQNTHDFVLEKFNEAEKKTLKKVIETAVEALSYAQKQGIDAAMNKYST